MSSRRLAPWTEAANESHEPGALREQAGVAPLWLSGEVNSSATAGGSPGPFGPAEPTTLRDRELLIIPKIVEYLLRAGEIHEGVWHVEGMSHEHIVATCVYVLKRGDELRGAQAPQANTERPRSEPLRTPSRCSREPDPNSPGRSGPR